MIRARTSDAIRRAEQPLLAAGAPLMRQAAAAVSAAVRERLRGGDGRARPGGGRPRVAGRGSGLRGRTVVLLVGSGHNGGDALFAGADLARRGARVLAVLTGARAHAAGLAALRAAGGEIRRLVLDESTDAVGAGGGPPLGGPPADGGREAGERGIDRETAVRRAIAADALVDGILGIGAQGGLRGPALALVADLAARREEAWLEGVRREGSRREGSTGRRSGPTAAAVGAPSAPVVRPWIVAVDVPSGIGVDDGGLPGPVLDADLTVAMGAATPGLLLPPASGAVGRLRVVDLGLAHAEASDAGLGGRAVLRLEPADAGALWPVPGPRDHKYTRGVLGVVAGSARYPGAGVLAVTAALRAGIGMVRCPQAPTTLRDLLLRSCPEVVTGPGRVQAWAIGPGLDPADERTPEVDWGLPVVVDAGGLALLPEHCAAHVVITPHAGELARLLDARGLRVDRAEVEAEPVRWAIQAQELTGATVLLKGSTTVVAGPQEVCAQADAPAWTATAGAGDVLAGLLGALLAGRSEDLLSGRVSAARLAAVAALAHGRAARSATPGGPVTALALAEALPGVVAELLAG